MSRSRFCKTSPRLHTGSFGRSIRGESIGRLRAQSLAGYLTSCPHGNAIGVFFLPIGYIMADRGWGFDGASEALRTVRAMGLIHYDEATEWVWVVETFRHEFGDDPPKRIYGDGKKEDSRLPLLRRLLEECRQTPHFRAFVDHHAPSYPYLLAEFVHPFDGASDGASDGAYDGASDGSGTGSLARDQPRHPGGGELVSDPEADHDPVEAAAGVACRDPVPADPLRDGHDTQFQRVLDDLREHERTLSTGRSSGGPPKASEDMPPGGSSLPPTSPPGAESSSDQQGDFGRPSGSLSNPEEVGQELAASSGLFSDSRPPEEGKSALRSSMTTPPAASSDRPAGSVGPGSEVQQDAVDAARSAREGRAGPARPRSVPLSPLLGPQPGFLVKVGARGAEIILHAEGDAVGGELRPKCSARGSFLVLDPADVSTTTRRCIKGCFGKPGQKALDTHPSRH
jgi:hypothetical protein